MEKVIDFLVEISFVYFDDTVIFGDFDGYCCAQRYLLN